MLALEFELEFVRFCSSGGYCYAPTLRSPLNGMVRCFFIFDVDFMPFSWGAASCSGYIGVTGDVDDEITT